jgi:ATP-dependent helicase/DNAse subunit B
MFFFTRILKLKSPPDSAPGYDALQLGTLIHSVFQQVFEKAAQQNLDTGSPEIMDIFQTIAGPALDEAPEKMGFRPQVWWNQTRKRLLANMKKGLENLMNETRGSLIAKIESSFGFEDDEYAPLIVKAQIESPSEVISTTIKVRGRIDRIDMMDSNTQGTKGLQGRTFQLIDYKTGSVSAYTNSAFQKGKILQLPLYMLALCKSMGLSPLTQAFYWSVVKGKKSALFDSKKIVSDHDGLIDLLKPAADSACLAAHKCRTGDFRIKGSPPGCAQYCPARAFCFNYKPSYF